MAVYERSYRGYHGALTAEWSRFLVIPRYAYQQVFASKGFVFFLALCAVYPLVCAVALYLPHNLNALKLFQIDPQVMIDAVQTYFFPMRFLQIQGFLAFVMTFLVGPPLISADLRNNALPLYLARPFSRAEYVLGKLAVLAILLSLITWIPGLLLFAFESYLLGWSWFLGNLRIAVGLVIGSAIWILVLSLLSLAVSAYVRWKPVARLALIGVYFLLPAFGQMINLTLATNWGRGLGVVDMWFVALGGLLGEEPLFEFPIAGAWFSLLGGCGICLLLLARKVRAYEVVR